MVHFGLNSSGKFHVHGHETNAQHLQLGRCEVGSHVETMRNQMYNMVAMRGVQKRGGDAWSLIFPWDLNASVNTIVDLEYKAAPVDQKLVSCTSNLGGSIGTLYSLREDVTINDGYTIGQINVRGNRIRATYNGIKPDADLLVYRATFFGESEDGNGVGDGGDIVGYADILPIVTSIDEKKLSMHTRGFRATPAVGLSWMSGGVVTKSQANSCLDGKFVPWSPDVPAILEHVIYEMKMHIA